MFLFLRGAAEFFRDYVSTNSFQLFNNLSHIYTHKDNTNNVMEDVSF